MDDEFYDDMGEAPNAVNFVPSILEFYGRLLGYVVILAIVYYISLQCAASMEEEVPKERPILKQGLMIDEEEDDDEDEDESDENQVEEIDTDEMLKNDGTRNRKAKKAPNSTLDPFPKDMNPLTYKQPKGEKVSFRDLHHAMLNRYKEKYPNHGPSMGSTRSVQDDEYDEEMKSLLKEHLKKVG